MDSSSSIKEWISSGMQELQSDDTLNQTDPDSYTDSLVEESDLNTATYEFSDLPADASTSVDEYSFTQDTGTVGEDYSFTEDTRTVGEDYSFTQDTGTVGEDYSFTEDTGTVGEDYSFTQDTGTVGEDYSFTQDTRTVGEEFSFTQDTRTVGEDHSFTQDTRTVGEEFSFTQDTSTVGEDYSFTQDTRTVGEDYSFTEDTTEDESDKSSVDLNTAILELSDDPESTRSLTTSIDADDSAVTLVPSTAAVTEPSIHHSITDLTTITSTIDEEPSSIIVDLSIYPDEAVLYERFDEIGHGAFGLVYEAVHKDTGETVAIKEIKLRVNKLHSCIAREINILKHFNHQHIVSLKEVCRSENTLSLVFEKCSQDLRKELHKEGKMDTFSACNIMRQILSGLAEMHNKGFIHRDLKPANILMKGHSVAKIGDLGLARDYMEPTDDCPNAYSPNKGTVTYRPPEIFFGSKNYGPSVDIWSAGLIFLELMTGERVLKGNSQLEIVITISELCGTISPDVWPEVQDLPDYSLFTLPINENRNAIDERFGDIVGSDLVLGLIKLMLTLNPLVRPTANEALTVLNKYLDK